MTIRVAVTVLLALAILGASLPAIEEARVQHADARVAAELDRLERVATGLAAENDVVPRRPARTAVTLHLPRGSWTTRALARLSVPRAPNATDVSWTVEGGTDRGAQFSEVALVAPDGLTLRTGGRQRVALELRRQGDRRVVIVRRTGAG